MDRINSHFPQRKALADRNVGGWEAGSLGNESGSWSDGARGFFDDANPSRPESDASALPQKRQRSSSESQQGTPGVQLVQDLILGRGSGRGKKSRLSTVDSGARDDFTPLGAAGGAQRPPNPCVPPRPVVAFGHIHRASGGALVVGAGVRGALCAIVTYRVDWRLAKEWRLRKMHCAASSSAGPTALACLDYND